MSCEPGPIDTDMNRDENAISPPCRRRARRWAATARPEEIGATVAFLASKDAGYITGASIAVDGGHNA